MLLFPTQYDSFANVIGEALCCGLPVITTKQAGGAEMIRPGVNGFVAGDMNALEELRAFVSRFLDPAFRRAAAAQAPAAVQQYTIARCAAETEAVLLKAYAEKRKWCAIKDLNLGPTD